jgi:polyisoprenoid-binding protein YceI
VSTPLPATDTSGVSQDLPGPGLWEIDPAHSSVEAVARHMMVTKVRGRFKSFSGTISVGDTPEESSADVTIDAGSIDTDEPSRDEHLRSGDFLDVANHPTLDFAGRSVRHLEGPRYEVEGYLTIRGVTRPVTLDVEYLGKSTDPWGQERALFSARAQLDREQFGITWNQALEAGGVLVSRKLGVEIEVSAVRR